jgi:hypothetical protein
VAQGQNLEERNLIYPYVNLEGKEGSKGDNAPALTAELYKPRGMGGGIEVGVVVYFTEQMCRLQG